MTRPAVVLVSILTSGLIAGVAHADEPALCAPVELVAPAVSPALRLRLPELAIEDGRKARALRNAGIVSTVVGTLFTLVGVGVMFSNLCFDSCNNQHDDGSGNAGITMLALGQLGVVGGIAMWAVGQTRATRADEVRVSLSASGVRMQF